MQAAKNFRNRAGTALRAAILAAAAAAIYWPALRGAFLWDDEVETFQSVSAQGLSSLKAVWLGQVGPTYYPLKATLEWLQWHLWHGDSLGFHAVNVGLHLACALLLWRIFVLLGIRAAWFGGLLFTVHPLCVESVAWMAEFKNTSSLFLLLLSFLAFLKFDRLRGAKGACLYYALSAAGFLAAMLCKSSVAAFPAALLLFAGWRRGRLCRRDLLEAAPFFAVSAGLSAVTIVFEFRHAIGHWAMPPDGIAARIAGFPEVAAFYLWKFIWPRALMPIYPRWDIHPFSALSIALWALLLGSLAGAWSRRAGWGRHALFGGGWFLVHLLPVSGIVPLAFLHLSRAADHLVYLPMLGLVGLCAAALGELTARFPSGSAALRMAAAAACVPLAWRARRYDAKFTDEQLLWTTNERLNPGSAFVHGNLADALARKGLYDQTIAQFKEALAIEPDYAEAHYNLGCALSALQRPREAIPEFLAAIRQKPDYSGAYYNLGNTLVQLGRSDEAIADYQAALRIKPDYAEAEYNLGNAFALEHRQAEAIPHYEAAIRLRPNYADAHCNLGSALFDLGRLREAEAEYEETLRIDPGFSDARVNLDRLRAVSNSAAR